MDGDELWRLLGRLKRAMLTDRRLSPEELHELTQLSEAIVDHARMIQEYRGSRVPYAIVEIPELARRFRETPRTIKDALALLNAAGRAEPFDSRGVWKLNLPAIFHSEEDDKGDRGAA
jgi:hypothetical protein